MTRDTAYNPRKNQADNAPAAGRLTLVFGKISELQSNMCRTRAEESDQDDGEGNPCPTFGLPVIQPFAYSKRNRAYSMPDVESMGVAILDESGSNGVILGCVYQEEDKPPVTSEHKHHITYADGTVIEYDRQSHTLTVSLKSKEVKDRTKLEDEEPESSTIDPVAKLNIVVEAEQGEVTIECKGGDNTKLNIKCDGDMLIHAKGDLTLKGKIIHFNP